MSTKVLVSLLCVVAAGCDRGELVLLPAHGSIPVWLDASPPPDQAPPPSDGSGPGPFVGPMQFECNSDDQCGGRRPYCDPRIRRCVECTGLNHCPWPTVCDLFTERCALPCQSNVDCSMTAQTRCDPNRHVCVGCTSNDQCFSPTRFCESSSGQCVECLRDNDCQAPWFCLENRNECVECVNDDNCPPGEFCSNGRCNR